MGVSALSLALLACCGGLILGLVERHVSKNPAAFAPDSPGEVFVASYAQIHPEHAEVPFRFDVLVKNKTPVFEQRVTRRTMDDMFRLMALVERADAIVEHELYYPSDQSFYCKDCPFQEPCRAWHRNRARLDSAVA